MEIAVPILIIVLIVLVVIVPSMIDEIGDDKDEWHRFRF